MYGAPERLPSLGAHSSSVISTIMEIVEQKWVVAEPYIHISYYKHPTVLYKILRLVLIMMQSIKHI
jgi:hypothetical protein